jgi:NitT/TauT family transport system ATP-binding protein
MSARPGRVSKIVQIDLPQPRTADTRETERYFELVTEVREALRSHESDAPVLADGERIRAEGLT